MKSLKIVQETSERNSYADDEENQPLAGHFREDAFVTSENTSPKRPFRFLTWYCAYAFVLHLILVALIFLLINAERLHLDADTVSLRGRSWCKFRRELNLSQCFVRY